MSQCLALQRQIHDYRRFDPFMPHARLLQEFWSGKCWKTLGYETVGQWISRRYPEGQVQPYTLLRIANRLGPYLSDEEIHRIGISKCYKLTQLIKPGEQPDPTLVEEAKKRSYKDLKRFVEQVKLGKKEPLQVGEHIHFRGLVHAPVNEEGVVYLFGMVSYELGFLVESVQQSYPDCVAKERVRSHPERWQLVRIEFEYRSSKFNHPPEGCDIVVCWEHDWPDCPVKRVIELKSKIKELPPEPPSR